MISIVFICGLSILIISLIRIFHQINNDIEMRNGIMNELLLGSICGVSDNLMKDYIARLKKHGRNSPQANALKNANKDDEDFIRFANNIEKIGKSLW